MCHSSLTSMIQQLCSSGFSIRVQLMGDILGKIEEKSDGHYKTNFLWPKQWGTWGDQPMFQLVEGTPPPPPIPPLEETLLILIREIKKQHGLEYLTSFL